MIAPLLPFDTFISSIVVAGITPAKVPVIKASYIVLNANDFLDLIAENLDPQSIFGYGYYGPPSSTAITIYDTICFAVFIIKKRNRNNKSKATYKFKFPHDLLY